MNKQLQDLMDRQRDWSDKTFAKGKFTYQRALPISYHLQKESRELTESIDVFLRSPNSKTAMEVNEGLAEVLLTLLDCASHLGTSAQSLLLYANQKHSVNTNQTID